MQNNYTEVFFGGLSIITQLTDEGMHHIRIKNPNELWNGTPADLEEMAGSHNYLKDACMQILAAQKSDDSHGFDNALQSIKEALHRSGISMFEYKANDGEDDLPF